jgi:hypothetical protein
MQPHYVVLMISSYKTYFHSFECITLPCTKSSIHAYSGSKKQPSPALHLKQHLAYLATIFWQPRLASQLQCSAVDFHFSPLVQLCNHIICSYISSDKTMMCSTVASWKSTFSILLDFIFSILTEHYLHCPLLLSMSMKIWCTSRIERALFATWCKVHSLSVSGKVKKYKGTFETILLL